MRLLVVLALASCGRFGFGDEAKPVDATNADGSIASLIHDYPLTADLDDKLGGPSLTPHGGSIGQAGYKFGINQGVTVANVMPSAVYSIDLKFELDLVAGYRKVIDFKGLGADSGLYVEDAMLQFVVIPVTDCPDNDCYTSATLYTMDQSSELTLTRDASGVITAYVDRAAVFSFDDAMNVGAFDTIGAALALFIDDTGTMTEASSGIVRDVRIYDTALTADQVAAQ